LRGCESVCELVGRLDQSVGLFEVLAEALCSIDSVHLGPRGGVRSGVAIAALAWLKVLLHLADDRRLPRKPRKLIALTAIARAGRHDGGMQLAKHRVNSRASDRFEA